MSDENASLKSTSSTKINREERPQPTSSRIHSTPTSREPSLTNGVGNKTHIPLRYGASIGSGRNRPHSMVETSKSRLVSETSYSSCSLLEVGESFGVSTFVFF